ncbi:MAG: GNAT family N-acetyltransferase [Alphaproteobacteria bacterium]
MASTEPRALVAEDAPALARLSVEAGWNQIADDWRLILGHGAGEGIFADDGTALASACDVPLTARSRWICMVLVTAAARRRGHATRLMARRIDAIERAGLVAGLDATELGRPVYERLGFRPLFALTRMRAAAPEWPDVDTDATIRPMTAADIPFVAAWDTGATGSDRRFLLAHLLDRMPRAARLTIRDGRIAGFAMARDGVRAAGIGPVAADDPALAAALTTATGRAIAGPTVVDLRDDAPGFRKFLESAGFTAERGFTRMTLGEDPALALTERLYAVAGPEFG